MPAFWTRLRFTCSAPTLLLIRFIRNVVVEYKDFVGLSAIKASPREIIAFTDVISNSEAVMVSHGTVFWMIASHLSSKNLWGMSQ